MPMRPSTIELREQAFTEMSRYIAVSSVFESRTVFEVLRKGEEQALVERPLVRPFCKNYDAIEDPMEWPVRFDLSKWVLIAAFDGDTWVGGAIGVFNTPGIDMLERRSDLLVLWDLRVSSEARRRGVGSALFRALETWGRKRNCRELKVETQNTNVAACRLYSRLGCALKQVNYGAYPDLPDEVQLFWRKAIDG